MRSDNKRTLTDGRAVGEDYVPLQNVAAFAWFQPFLDSKEIKLETALALQGGRKVCIMAKLNRDPITVQKNDVVDKYLMLSNSHDGTMTVRVGFTPIRVICMNTLIAAIKSEQSTLIRVRHSGEVETNLDKIRDTVNVWNQSFETTGEKYKLLASKNINQKDLEKYITTVFNMQVGDNNKLAKRTQGTLEDMFDRYYLDVFQHDYKTHIAKVQEAFEQGKGSEFAKSQGNYWQAYNCITQYLSFERGRSVDNRLNSLWFGDSYNRNQFALETALNMAA